MIYIRPLQQNFDLPPGSVPPPSLIHPERLCNCASGHDLLHDPSHLQIEKGGKRRVDQQRTACYSAGYSFTGTALPGKPDDAQSDRRAAAGVRAQGAASGLASECRMAA